VALAKEKKRANCKSISNGEAKWIAKNKKSIF
jgi:hypothetical protein